VAQPLLAYDLFARKDSLNVSCPSELYFLYSMLEGDRIDPGLFLINQLYSTATCSTHRIVIGGLIIPIARLVGVKPNADDRVEPNPDDSRRFGVVELSCF